MTIVAVAGGFGDLGRLITDALLNTGKHEVYILSRKVDESVRDLSYLIDCVSTDCEEHLEPNIAIKW